MGTQSEKILLIPSSLPPAFLPLRGLLGAAQQRELAQGGANLAEA